MNPYDWPSGRKSDYLGNGTWCGLPSPTDMSSYVFSDFRPHRDHPAKCDPCVRDDDWGFREDDDLHPSFDYATKSRSLQVWDGYGVGPETIDCDAMIRMATEDASLMGRADGRQLSTRVFVAAPSLANKRPDPTKELSIIAGTDTSDTRRCYRLGEETIDRFDPGVCAVPIDHILPPWVVGGVFSRDISRNPKFQRAIRKAAMCERKVPKGAEDVTALSFGPPPSLPSCSEKKRKEKKKKGSDERAELAWEKLEALALGYGIERTECQ